MIHVNCEACKAERKLMPQLVSVGIREDEAITVAFTCLSCQAVNVKVYRETSIVMAMIEKCPTFEHPHIPELLEKHDGPRITPDDVLEFHNHLYPRQKETA